MAGGIETKANSAQAGLCLAKINILSNLTKPVATMKAFLSLKVLALAGVCLACYCYAELAVVRMDECC